MFHDVKPGRKPVPTGNFFTWGLLEESKTDGAMGKFILYSNIFSNSMVHIIVSCVYASLLHSVCIIFFVCNIVMLVHVVDYFYCQEFGNKGYIQIVCKTLLHARHSLVQNYFDNWSVLNFRVICCVFVLKWSCERQLYYRKCWSFISSNHIVQYFIFVNWYQIPNFFQFNLQNHSGASIITSHHSHSLCLLAGMLGISAFDNVLLQENTTVNHEDQWRHLLLVMGPRAGFES